MGCAQSQEEKEKVRREEKAKKKAQAKKQRLEIITKLRQVPDHEDLLRDPVILNKVVLLSEFPSVALLVWSSDGIVLFYSQALLDLIRHDDVSLKPGNRVRKVFDLPCEGADDGDYTGLLYREAANVAAHTREGAELRVNLYTTNLSEVKAPTNPLLTSITPVHDPSEDVPAVPGDKHVYCSWVVEASRASPTNAGARDKRASVTSVSPRGKDRPGSPEGKRAVLGDIVVALGPDGALRELSPPARQVLGAGEADELPEAGDELLHPAEAKTLRVLLSAEYCEDMGAVEKRYVFRCFGGDAEVPLVYASRFTFGDTCLLRFQVPPRRRNVLFKRKALPDEVAVLMESIPRVAMLVNKRGEIEYWNALAEQLFGASCDDVVKQPLATFLPLPYAATHPTSLTMGSIPREALQGKRPVVVRSLASESVVPVFLSAKPYQMTSEKLLFLTLLEEANEPLCEAHQAQMEQAVVESPDHPLALRRLDMEQVESPRSQSSPQNAWLTSHGHHPSAIHPL